MPYNIPIVIPTFIWENQFKTILKCWITKPEETSFNYQFILPMLVLTNWSCHLCCINEKVLNTKKKQVIWLDYYYQLTIRVHFSYSLNSNFNKLILLLSNMSISCWLHRDQTELQLHCPSYYVVQIYHIQLVSESRWQLCSHIHQHMRLVMI